MLLLSSVYASSRDQAPAPAFKDGDFWQFKVTEDIADVTSTKELGVVPHRIGRNRP